VLGGVTFEGQKEADSWAFQTWAVVTLMSRFQITSLLLCR
jgi:hypothetical protein